MWFYVLIAVGVAMVTAMFLYLDSRLFDRPKKKMVYIKVILMNIIIVLATLYILAWLSPTSNIKDIVQAGGGKAKIEGPVVEIKEIGEQMFSDPAPF